MKRAVGCILKAYGNSKEYNVRDVDVRSIIGYRLNGSGNARNADSEPQSEVEV
jgi:hypothetical protein